MQCIAALFLTCREERFLAMMGAIHLGDAMVELSLRGVNQDETKNVLISKIIATLAHDESSRRFLHASTTCAPNLLALIKANTSVECGRWLAQALRFLCVGKADPYSLVESGAVCALVALSNLHDSSLVISTDRGGGAPAHQGGAAAWTWPRSLLCASL